MPSENLMTATRGQNDSLQFDATNAWLLGVDRRCSPNCDDRPSPGLIDLIVVHGISLPPGEFGGPWIDALFHNTLEPEGHSYFRDIAELRVSAHVLVRRPGQIIQYVPFNRRAWHAGRSTFAGRADCNDFSIGIELEGADDVPYTDAQYACIAQLSKTLMSIWPGISRERIVGHCHVAPGRKSDPGEAFDWERFYALLV